MPQPVVQVAHTDGTAVLTLNRPKRRNALNSALTTALYDTVGALSADPGVRVIVLTGADPAFCAGLDLFELGSTGANLQTVGPSTGHNRPWAATGTPVIGAVNGVAITGGLEIALHCDFLIASAQAAFGDTHARVGLLPGWGLSYLLPQAVGVRRAREMSLTGRLVPASEALTWGLVNSVVAPTELLPLAMRLATQIQKIEPDTVAAFLDLYTRTGTGTLAEAAQVESTLSLDWMRRSFSPAAVAARVDAVIEGGRAQI